MRPPLFKTSQYSLFYLMVGVIVLLLVLCRYERTFFSVALKQVHIEEQVRLEGVQYEVREGKIFLGEQLYQGPLRGAILRLAYEKVTARYAPPLSIAGTDPQEFDHALAMLLDTQEQLAGIQEKSEDRMFVAHALYPGDFLSRLAALERSRLRFLETGDRDDAQNYQKLIQDTVQAYREDLQQFRAAFVAVVPEGTDPYVTQEVVVTREFFLSVLTHLEKSAHEVLRDTKRRAWCTQGLLFVCDVEDISLPLPPPLKEKDPTVDQETLASLEVLVRGGMLLQEPTFEIAQSACVGTAPHLFKFYKKSLPASLHSFRQFFLVGDIRFVPSRRYPDVPFYHSLAERGIEWVLDSPFSYYKCPHFGNDLSALWAVEAVREFAAAGTLSQYATGEVATTLSRLEQTLSASTVRERDSREYLLHARALLKTGVIPPAVAARVVDLLLATRNHSAHLDQLLLWIVAAETANMRLIDEGIPVDLEAPYLFYVRSAFTSLFLSNNRSFTSADAVFHANTLPPGDGPQVWYSALSAQGRAEGIEEDISLYNRLHEAPAEY